AERTTRGLGELAEAAERYAGPGTLSNQRSSALRGAPRDADEFHQFSDGLSRALHAARPGGRTAD
ncbi:unnamed protein product, partial [Durusdinium trenchii]